MTGIFDLYGSPIGDVIKKELNISVADDGSFFDFTVKEQGGAGHCFQQILCI